MVYFLPFHSLISVKHKTQYKQTQKRFTPCKISILLLIAYIDGSNVKTPSRHQSNYINSELKRIVVPTSKVIMADMRTLDSY